MEKSECRGVVMIAGGSRGIGKYLVDNLISEYHVSVCGRSADNLDVDGLLSMGCDLRRRKEVDKFVDATLKKFGRVDMMIYSAGLFPYDRMLNVKEKDIDELYEVVVKGYIFVCQDVIPTMCQQGGGRIINIGSIRGLTVTPDKMAYSAMKRAAASITESVNVEYGKYGVKATSLHLGTVDTESSRGRYEGKFNHLNLVKESDMLGAVKFLLALTQHAVVDSFLLNGRP